MYDRTVFSVRTSEGITSEFLITLSLYQESTLNLYLFTLVIDELTKLIQEKFPWICFLADNIVLIRKTRSGVNTKLEFGEAH